MSKHVFISGLFLGSLAFSQTTKTIQVRDVPANLTGVENYLDAEYSLKEKAKEMCPQSARAEKITIHDIDYQAKFCGVFNLGSTPLSPSIIRTKCYANYVASAEIGCPLD